MKDLTKKAIERLIYIPYDLERVEKSELTLLREASYFELHQEINENEIIEVLKMHPNALADWLQLSRDSRSSER